ncbi:MAG: hypothetical protein ACK6BQ_13260, partial [Bacteroidota bacterium]
GTFSIRYRIVSDIYPFLAVGPLFCSRVGTGENFILACFSYQGYLVINHLSGTLCSTTISGT